MYLATTSLQMCSTILRFAESIILCSDASKYNIVFTVQNRCLIRWENNECDLCAFYSTVFYVEEWNCLASSGVMRSDPSSRVDRMDLISLHCFSCCVDSLYILLCTSSPSLCHDELPCAAVLNYLVLMCCAICCLPWLSVFGCWMRGEERWGEVRWGERREGFNYGCRDQRLAHLHPKSNNSDMLTSWSMLTSRLHGDEYRGGWWWVGWWWWWVIGESQRKWWRLCERFWLSDEFCKANEFLGDELILTSYDEACMLLLT